MPLPLFPASVRVESKSHWVGPRRVLPSIHVAPNAVHCDSVWVNKLYLSGQFGSYSTSNYPISWKLVPFGTSFYLLHCIILVKYPVHALQQSLTCHTVRVLDIVEKRIVSRILGPCAPIYPPPSGLPFLPVSTYCALHIHRHNDSSMKKPGSAMR